MGSKEAEQAPVPLCGVRGGKRPKSAMSVPPKGSFGTPRFAAYRDALNAISARTRTPLPSLVLSFAILHELTAIVPVVGFFFAARGLGVGERVVGAVTASGGERDEDSWVKGKGREWVDEGSQWVEKVGSRYGVFGFEKRTKETAAPRGDISSRIAGDAANAIVAYGLTKVSRR